MTEEEREKIRTHLARLSDSSCEMAYQNVVDVIPDFKEVLDNLPIAHPDIVDGIEAREAIVSPIVQGWIDEGQIQNNMAQLFLAAHRAAICWAYRISERKCSN